MTALERFEAKIEKIPECGCWIWTASCNKEGYGHFKLNGKVFLAHRVSLMLHLGYLSNDDCVLHKCDTPSCVNPRHLFIGSHNDNKQDSVKKNRHKFPVFFGENHPGCKISNADVIAIRKDQRPQKIIAKHYGVSQSHISDIKTGKLWRTI